MVMTATNTSTISSAGRRRRARRAQNARSAMRSDLRHSMISSVVIRKPDRIRNRSTDEVRAAGPPVVVVVGDDRQHRERPQTVERAVIPELDRAGRRGRHSRLQADAGLLDPGRRGVDLGHAASIDAGA